MSLLIAKCENDIPNYTTAASIQNEGFYGGYGTPDHTVKYPTNL